MPVDNGVVNAPITMPSDIDEALTYSVGGDVAVACSNQKVIGRESNGKFILSPGSINMWAKYKPVRGGGPVDQCRYPNSPGYVQNLWKGLVAETVDRYQMENGIGIPVIEYLSDTNKHYKYYPPIPGVDWSRLTDFNKYYVDAVLPFTVYMPDELRVQVGDSFYVSMADFSYDAGYQELNLKATDFNFFKDKYLVLYLYNESTKRGQAFINTQYKVGEYLEDDRNIPIELSYDEMKNWIENGHVVNAYMWLTSSPDNAFSSRCGIKITPNTVVNKTYIVRGGVVAYSGYYQFTNINLGYSVYITRTGIFKGRSIYDDNGDVHTNVQYELTFDNWAARAYTDLPEGRSVEYQFMLETAFPDNEEGDFVNPAVPRVLLHKTNDSAGRTVTVNAATSYLEYSYPGNPTLTGNTIPVIGLYPIRLKVYLYANGVAFGSQPIENEVIIDLNEIKNW